jgi:beta-lactamase regulating signal transducer with metallopeptidase domain
VNPYELIADWSSRAWPLLANHLWQATLFSLLSLLAAVSLGRAPARARYFAWLVALSKFALPSVLIFFLASRAGIDLSSVTARDAGPESSALNVSPLLSPVTAPAPFVRSDEPVVRESEAPGAVTSEKSASTVSSFSLTGVAFCVWLTGFALLALSWLRKSYALSVSISKGREIKGGREAEALRRVRRLFGVRRGVRLVVTRAVSEPGVWGVWRPVVVLPEGVAERLDDAELEAVFMHELAHVKRWDNLAGNFQRALCCLFWFHPVIWLIDRRLLAEREQACDDMVVRRGGLSEVYASGIAKVCRYCLGREAAGLAKVTGSDLKKRIERIITRRAGKRMSAPHAAVLSLLTFAAVTLSIVSGEGAIADRHHTEEDSAAAAPRFEFVASVSGSADESLVRAIRPQARGVSPGGNASGQLAPKDSAGQTAQPDKADASRTENANANASTNTNTSTNAGAQPVHQPDASSDIAPPRESRIPQSQITPTQISQPRPPPPDEPSPSRDGDIRAAVVSASEVDYGDLPGFIGRYEVDPSRAENFVLDITLEGGGLWLKPSHAKRRRLMRKSETDFVDAYSDYNLTAVSDERGRVVGLKLNSWGRRATARKLSLPRPSLMGNVTFRLRGFDDARVVAVAGDFNKWNQSQLLFTKEGGEWVCRVNLPAGTYQYKFIVDGDWLTDPNNPKTVHDERGIENSLLRAE